MWLCELLLCFGSANTLMVEPKPLKMVATSLSSEILRPAFNNLDKHNNPSG